MNFEYRNAHGRSDIPFSRFKYKKDCYTGQNPCRAVLFLHKRKLTELFAAHDTPTCLRHFHTASRAGIATHRVTLSTATPKRPAAESSVSRGLRISAQPKSKGRQPAYTHRRPFFHPATKLLKRRVLPSHRNVTMSARKASFTGFSIAELRLCCTKTVIF